jgi:LmbE family N-acetylglucosaminyl deacetylase
VDESSVVTAAADEHRPRRKVSRPPVGAIWGWVQTVAGRKATEELLPGSALVLSPHQDDETIGCGLLMASKLNRGVAVAVAVATDGRCGWFSQAPRPAPEEIAEIRRREWHAALDVLTVPRADRFELGFTDGELSEHENALSGHITELLRRVRPSQVFVSSSGDPHPDHRTLARAVPRALAHAYDPGPGSPRPRVYAYRVYPGEGLWPGDQPCRVRVGTAVARISGQLLGRGGRRALLVRAPGLVPTKVAAIDAFGSQRRLLDGELRFVWDSGVELYWPIDWPATPGVDPDPRHPPVP